MDLCIVICQMQYTNKMQLHFVLFCFCFQSFFVSSHFSYGSQRNHPLDNLLNTSENIGCLRTEAYIIEHKGSKALEVQKLAV